MLVELLPVSATLVAAIALVADLFVRRRRLVYRVLLDSPVDASPGAMGLAELVVRQGAESVPDPSIVVLRFANTGSTSLELEDFVEPLSVRFPGRRIADMAVQDAEPPALQEMLLENFHKDDYVGTDGIRFPKIWLGRRDRFRLLVLLSGPGENVEVSARISGGHVRAEQQPSRFSRTAVLTGVFAVLVAASLVLFLLRGFGGLNSAGRGCSTGPLQVLGSSDIQPLAGDLASGYRATCSNASVSLVSSTNALNALSASTPSAGDLIAMTDQGSNGVSSSLVGRPLAAIPFAAVVNRSTGITALTTTQLQQIYSGQITNWAQVGGQRQAISIVSRDAESSTRQLFDQKVIKQAEPPASSADCLTKSILPNATYVRCEVPTITDLLRTVDAVPGAIGYAPASGVILGPDAVTVTIDGNAPAAANIKAGLYPFWSVAQVYTVGTPPVGSPAAAFVQYIESSGATAYLQSRGYIPCTGTKPC